MNEMRVRCFDGLKAVSAIIVMLSHYFLCFLRWDWLATVPFVRLLFDGGMAVFIFIMLSAFGICASLDKDDVKMAIVHVGLKRYFRLSLPLLWPSVLGYLICVLGLNYNVAFGTVSNNEWVRTLLPADVAINQLTSGVAVGVLRGSAFINPLWMMKYIFLGTFITIPLFFVVNALRKTLYKLVFILIMGILFYSESIFYAAIVAGVLLYVVHKMEIRHETVICAVSVAILVALELFMANATHPVMFLKGTLAIIIVRNGALVCRSMESAFFQWLNRLSYQIYLVHTIVITSVCSYVYANCEHNLLNGIGLFFLLVSVVLGLAFVFSKMDCWVSGKMNLLFKKVLPRS